MSTHKKLQIEDSPLMLKLIHELGIDSGELAVLIDSAPKRYKLYTIPKKNGGERKICHPAAEIKLLQSWLTRNYLNKFPVHENATAYKNGGSIKKNALPHAKNCYLCKIDFKDFFPSISPDTFFGFLKNKDNDLSPHDISALKNILFCSKGKAALYLAIGAPSSPMLSNILMYEFDAAMQIWSKAKGITYTRYADDLTFSTNDKNILKECEKEVLTAIGKIDYLNLKINQQKTIHTSKKHRRFVTGLTLTNTGEVSLGRTRKREISSLIHKFKLQELNNKSSMALRGHIAFAIAVEEDFVIRMKRKYGEDVIDSIKKFQPDIDAE